jgi:hypothetical protein
MINFTAVHSLKTLNSFHNHINPVDSAAISAFTRHNAFRIYSIIA